MELDLHDGAQWAAFVALLAGLWWRLRQRDDRIVAEAVHQTKIEERIAALERRFEKHQDEDDQKLGQIMDTVKKIFDELHALDKKVDRMEAKLETR